MAPSPQHDEVNSQLRDLERQGGGMARLAHWCAGLLLVAFSLGSLLSISHAAFITFLAQWNAGQLDIPDGISLVVNVLLVVAADVGLLYAASVLRVLSASEAPKEEQRVHTWAMWGASILESSTYLYLAWEFDRPATIFLWGIMIARAIAAPLFAAYLSMARPVPVGPGDVAYHASLASGKGVVRDVATLAADTDAPLERKVRIYRAAARMAPHDRTRFDAIVEAVSVPDAPATALSHPLELPQPTTSSVTPSPDAPDRPPTGPGSPTTAPRRTVDTTVRTDNSKVVQLPSQEAQRTRRQSAAQARATRSNGRRVRTAEQRQQEAAQKRAERLALVRVWLAEDPTIATRELVRRLQAVEHSRVSESTVNSLRREVEAARTAQAGQFVQ